MSLSLTSLGKQLSKILLPLKFLIVTLFAAACAAAASSGMAFDLQEGAARPAVWLPSNWRFGPW